MANEGEADPTKDRNLVYRVAALLAGAGIAADLVFSVGMALKEAEGSRLASFCSTFGGGVLLGVGTFTAGALFGLLFGIPKATTQGQPKDERTKFLGANNNLVQISDWLTKVLVGATLTQLNRLPAALSAFGERHGTAVGGATVAISLLTGFSTSGFLSAYLFTRVVLQHALHRANKMPDDAKDKAAVEPAKEAEDPSPPQTKKDTTSQGNTQHLGGERT